MISSQNICFGDFLFYCLQVFGQHYARPEQFDVIVDGFMIHVLVIPSIYFCEQYVFPSSSKYLHFS